MQWPSGFLWVQADHFVSANAWWVEVTVGLVMPPPSRAPVLPRVQFKAWKCGQLSWCAVDDHVHLAFCRRVSLLTTSVSCLPAVSSDEGPYSKGSKDSGGTDQSHSARRRSLSGTIQSNLTLHHGDFCLIHATASNSPASSKRRSHAVGFCVHVWSHMSALFCLMLHCFECLDKVKITLVWHTCHWY